MFARMMDRIVNALFGNPTDETLARIAAMERHPAGKGRPQERQEAEYDDTAFLARVRSHIEAYGANPT